MSIAKTVELSAEGDTLEQATENLVRQASETIDNISEVYVNDYRARVENGQIQVYRVRGKVTFVLQDKD
ncbi:MAG: dodecin domain-containing protein [Bacteroidetes bacterium]|jgi:flavin-binding protein dodecin|nr:dodecin domain-containing protein [Bacteroidota bacterium]